MKKKSAGAEILKRLTGFVEVLKSDQPVSKTFTCRRVVLDLNPTSYDPDLVKETRSIFGASQALFAQFLGVSVKTVRSWEQGANEPSEMACRFMDEIRGNPKFWLERFLGSQIAK